jgi:hypothetical protein
MSEDNNTENIRTAINDMLNELTDAELLELEDFIVNECSNEAFVDDDGNYPNIFRMFVTSPSNRPY